MSAAMAGSAGTASAGTSGGTRDGPVDDEGCPPPCTSGSSSSRTSMPMASERVTSLNTCALSFNISFGLGSSGSTRVSNELGAGRSQAALLAVCVVIFMATIGGLFLGLTMILFRRTWGYLFSNEEEVVKYVATMMPLLALSNFLDGIQCALSGIVRGCGWQKIGAFVNLGAYYLVGIPFAVFFALVLHIGGKGLWMGIICALFVQVLSLLIITVRTSWEKEAKKATDTEHAI
ncbi:hypothetical protein HHK36_006763 [Tetracentron sinense]|uniref:Protein DETOXIFICATION n=1 Tax=Tetracentron sinense TaxID=13715 RepID=A0A834ZHR4_TETSI|nr:hypothetical protein HHK36_006763 [Tetracentron sinense]